MSPHPIVGMVDTPVASVPPAARDGYRYRGGFPGTAVDEVVGVGEDHYICCCEIGRMTY
jgi:hypothetical protein